MDTATLFILLHGNSLPPGYIWRVGPDGVDTVGESSITLTTGTSADLMNASWAFPDTAVIQQLDTLEGGGVFLDTAGTPILRFGYQWYVILNTSFVWIGPNGIAGYSTSQDAKATQIQRVLGRMEYPDGLISFYSPIVTQMASRAIVGPNPTATSVSQQPDADGNLVDWPNVINGKGVVVHPAYQNLFTPGTIAEQIIALTAQRYCLQVFGTGASCVAGAYGSATVGNPLIFAATAGNCTFTPTTCENWMLTAAGGYVFNYIAPGVTAASTSATYAGNGLSVPLSREMRAIFGWKNIVIPVGDSLTVGYDGYLEANLVDIKVDTVIGGVSGNRTDEVLARIQSVLSMSPACVTLLIGINDILQDIPLVTIKTNISSIVSALVSNGIYVVISTVLPWKLNTLWTDARQEITDLLNTWIYDTYSDVQNVTAIDGYLHFEDGANPDQLLPAYAGADKLHLSIAGYTELGAFFATGVPLAAALTPDDLPSNPVFTLAALISVGASTADFDTAIVVDQNIFAVNTTGKTLRARHAAANNYPAMAEDGTTNSFIANTTYTRNERHLLILRFNSDDTQYRAECQRLEADMTPINSVPVVGGWANYDGSFNPFTHLWIGYNLAVPHGYLQVQLWNKGATNAEIVDLLKYAGD